MKIVALLLLAFCPSNATAQTTVNALESYQVAADLGGVIAAAAPCGFTVDLDAIDKYAAEKVSPDDLGFANSLSGQTSLAAFGLQRMPPDSLQLHCAAIRRSAESHGFIKP